MTDDTNGNIGRLLRCYEGLRNWRALVLLGGGVVVGMGLLLAAGKIDMSMHGAFGNFAELVLGVMALLVCLAGINGAGLLLVDQADGRAPRGFAGAFFGGLSATLTTFIALLAMGVVLVLVIGVIYLLSLLGKIPGIGPIFAFLFAGPGAVVLAFCYGVLVIGTPLLLVAVWRGEGIMGSLGRAIDIVIKRPLDALLHFLMLALIEAPVAIFVFVLMAITSAFNLYLYSPGISDGFGGMYGYGGSPFDMLLGSAMSGAARMGAAAASVGLVYALLVAMFALVGLFGYVMVYDSLSAGLASRAAERLRGGFNQIKQKVEQNRPRAAGPVAPPTAAPAARSCGACGAPLAAGDQFCGECGHRN